MQACGPPPAKTASAGPPPQDRLRPPATRARESSMLSHPSSCDSRERLLFLDQGGRGSTLSGAATARSSIEPALPVCRHERYLAQGRVPLQSVRIGRYAQRHVPDRGPSWSPGVLVHGRGVRVERSIGGGSFRAAVVRLLVDFIHGGAFFAVADACAGQRTRGSHSHGGSPHHRGARLGSASSQVLSRRPRTRIRSLDVRRDACRRVCGRDRVGWFAHRASGGASVLRGRDYPVRWELHHRQLANICTTRPASTSGLLIELEAVAAPESDTCADTRLSVSSATPSG